MMRVPEMMHADDQNLPYFGSPGLWDCPSSVCHVSCVRRQQWWHVRAVIDISELFMVHLTYIGDLNLQTQI